MKNFTTIIIGAAVAAGMFFAGRRCGYNNPVPVVTRIDTVIVRDTLRDTVLVPVERSIVRVDTLWMRSARDTARVETAVPIERKTYATQDYRAVVEGFRPALVEMELFRKTALVTRETTRAVHSPKWGIGIQAGYGLSSKGAGPYIGIGIQYHLIAW